MGSAPIPDELRERIKDLWLAGETSSSIAEKVGRTRNSCIGLVTRMNLPKRAQDVTQERVQQAKSQHQKVRQEVLKKAPSVVDTEMTHEPFRFEDGSLVTLETLGNNMCRYPIGHEDTLTFCGQPRKSLTASYCPSCHARAYRPNNPNARLSDEDKANMEQMSRVAGSQRIFG